MDNNLCIVDLPGHKNYAILSPYRITYGLDASTSELRNLVDEEKQIIEDTRSDIKDWTAPLF